MKNNFKEIFNTYLKILGAKVTKTSANRFLESHPDEGTMLAYTDALDHFKIENAAAKIELQDLEELPTPLITFLKEDGGIFTIIKSVKNGMLTWLHQEKGWIQTELEEFSENWSGMVLYAETDEYSGEKDFRAKRKAEFLKNLRIPLTMGLTSILILAMIFKANVVSATVYALFFLKFLGMVLASLLLIKSIDSSNELVKKFCTTGSKVNCQSILDSPVAKITPWFSWSDAGFIYFFASFFGLLLSHRTSEALNTFLSIQLIFTAVALIFSSYSLYYQAVKAKMWCTLCLGVVASFFLEAIVLSLNFPYDGFFVDLPSILNVLLGFMVPIAFLLLFKNVAIKAQESKKLKKELNKLKSNPMIFESLMSGQPQMPELPEDMSVILLGNQEAQHTITFVSKLLCSPCANMHLKIARLLSENDNINCQMIFISNPDRNDPGGLFVRKLFSLPNDLRAEALNQWFERNDKNFENWNENYKDYDELSGLTNIQEGHNYWANIAEVRRTPAIFINGKVMPEIINVEDLSIQLSHLPATTFNNGFANQSI